MFIEVDYLATAIFASKKFSFVQAGWFKDSAIGLILPPGACPV